jgi:hypothetical protein
MTKKNILLSLCVLFFFSCSKDDEIIDKLPEDTIDVVYTLPVVVHIIHSGEKVGYGFNISKERVVNQLKTLNDDFRKKEGTLGYNTHPLGTDVKIAFKLAEIAPDGNSTDGITRVNYHDVNTDTTNDWVFDGLPDYGYWSKQNYINIWVFPFKPNIILGQSSVPYLDIPGLNSAKPDGTTGVMIVTPHFGASDIVGGSNLGRTLTHEMGHFLGLEHLWGKTEKANCLDFDDYCDDTPAVSRRSGNCDGAPIVSCSGETILTQNYMDYTNDACMNMFTKDQAIRMRHVLRNNTIIKSLITSTSIHRN